MNFNDLNLIEPLLDALADEGYTQPTPIQQQAIPIVLEQRDLLGCAQTGTGKTAAFALPILQLLYQHKPRVVRPAEIKVLILTPTRELAIQIDQSFAAYGKNTGIRHTVIFGGVSQQPQTEALKRGATILTATPGRLLDLMQQGFIDLQKLDIFVLDEADRMLDMGFIHDVKKVIARLPQQRQTLFFSATMPPEIQKLAQMLLTNPAKVEVTPPSSTVDKIEQSLYHTNKTDKQALLLHLINEHQIRHALVFTRTKHGADRIARFLHRNNTKAAAIHGNKSQNARQNALNDFKNGQLNVLVATDIAARGIDIEALTHVFNFDLPNVPETYVHRIGRTGRAGNEGIAISFCDTEQHTELRDIERLIKKKIPVVSQHPYLVSATVPAAAAAPISLPKNNSNNHNAANTHKPAMPTNNKPTNSHKSRHFGRGK